MLAWVGLGASSLSREDVVGVFSVTVVFLRVKVPWQGEESGRSSTDRFHRQSSANLPQPYPGRGWRVRLLATPFVLPCSPPHPRTVGADNQMS